MIYFSVNKLYVFEKLIFLALKRCIAFPITLNSFWEKNNNNKKKNLFFLRWPISRGFLFDGNQEKEFN